MARYKDYDYSQGKFIPIHFDKQILRGTFGYSLHCLIENKIDLSLFDTRYRIDKMGVPSYDPRDSFEDHQNKQLRHESRKSR